MSNKTSNEPPGWATRFLKWFCPPLLLEEIEGDLLERFELDTKRVTRGKARRNYTMGVIRFFNFTTLQKARALNKKQTKVGQQIHILTTYLKIGARNLGRQKITSAINIFGLTIGLTCFLLAALFVRDEWSFDQHHPDGSSKFRVIATRGGQNQSGSWASSSPAVGPTLAKDFPEVTNTLRIAQIRQKLLFKFNDKKYLEEKGFYAEPAIFEFFHLPLKYGSRDSLLHHPEAIVISEKLSNKYFGAIDPVGQIIQINNKDVRVAGVFENLDPHSHLQFNYLLSFEYLKSQVSKERIRSWVWQDFYNYIQLREPSKHLSFEQKLLPFVEKYVHPETKKLGFHYYLKLQPLDRIHLYSSHLQNDVAVRGNYKYVMGLATVGLFLLFIACMNFVNLAVARSIKRAKEVGIRKTTGATKSQIITQFMVETCVLVGITLCLAIGATKLTLPAINQYLDKTLVLHLWNDPIALGSLVLLGLITSIIAGSYPAVTLARFSPGHAFQRVYLGSLKGSTLRKILVGIQFAISVFLIASLSIIYQQVQFLKNGDMGFDRAQLLHFPMKGKMFTDFEKVRTEFQRIPGVLKVSTCFGIPGDIIAGDNIIVPGQEAKTLPARILAIDHHYLATMDMTVVAGRNFDQKKSTDVTSAFIINETAVKTLGLGQKPSEAIGKPLHWEMWSHNDSLKVGTVIGVVKDFNYQSLTDPIQTVVMHIDEDAYWKVALRIEAESIAQTLKRIDQTWKSFETEYPLDYQFVDESFGIMYQDETRLSAFFKYLCLIAIFISLIGAFGLMMHSIEQKRKEISIRKVLGAPWYQVVGLLSIEFFLVVLVSGLVSLPIIWFTMSTWLNDFAYRISLSWHHFALGIGMVTLLVVLTIGAQTMVAVAASPIDSLRED